MLLFLLCLPLAVVIITHELRRKKANKYFDIFTFVNLMFLFLYCFIPIYMIFNQNSLPIWATFVDFSNIYIIESIIYIYIFYSFLLVGYYLYDKFPIFRKAKIYNTDLFRVSNILHLMISLIAFVLFVFSIGGISSFFTTNTLFRSGSSDITSVGYLRNMILFIPITSHIIFAKMLTYDKRNLVYYVYMSILAITFILSIAIYFNRASRLSTIFYIFIFLLIYLLIKKKLNIPLVIVSISVFIFYTLYGKRLFNLFSSTNEFTLENDSDFSSVILQEFSFPILNIIVASKDRFLDMTYRFYIDIVYGITNLLPSSILPFDPPKIEVTLNSEKYLDYGGIPVDIISFNYYSLGIAGIILGAIFTGYIIRVLENILSDKDNMYIIVAYVHILSFVTLRLPYTSPTNSLKSNFNVLIFLLCILLFNKVYVYYVKPRVSKYKHVFGGEN